MSLLAAAFIALTLQFAPALTITVEPDPVEDTQWIDIEEPLVVFAHAGSSRTPSRQPDAVQAPAAGVIVARGIVTSAEGIEEARVARRFAELR